MDNINETLNTVNKTGTADTAYNANNASPAPQAARTAVPQAVNRLYFSAREWTFNKDCKNNVGSRSFMQGPDGVIGEAFTIGDWGWNWTEIVSKTLILPKNTLHTFTFWLNGGENDNNNEVCRLEIIYNNDWDNRYTYNLNRNFIKPLKKCRGWELYEIPFMTANNEYTQLKFVAQRAYMTVMQAKDASEYESLPDIPDEFEGERPQRHNIIFDDGFPTNTWYSTKNLRAQHEKRRNGAEPNAGARQNTAYAPKAVNFDDNMLSAMHTILESAQLPPSQKSELIRELWDRNGVTGGNGENNGNSGHGWAGDTLYRVNEMLDNVNTQISGLPGMAGEVIGGLNGLNLNEEIRKMVENSIASGKFDPGADSADDIADRIADSISDKLDELADTISDNITDYADRLEDMFNGVRDDFDEIKDAMGEED